MALRAYSRPDLSISTTFRSRIDSSAASAIPLASTTLPASGFSTNSALAPASAFVPGFHPAKSRSTCLPALIAAKANSRCVTVGVDITTASTSPRNTSSIFPHRGRASLVPAWKTGLGPVFCGPELPRDLSRDPRVKVADPFQLGHLMKHHSHVLSPGPDAHNSRPEP